jgi:hypothetical protein
MITPAKDFREDPKRSAGWQDIVDSKRFKDAATVALAQLELDQPAPVSMEAAVARAHHIQGAKLFLEILTKLTEPSPIIQRLKGSGTLHRT